VRPGSLTDSGGCEKHSSGTILGRTAELMPSKKSLRKLNRAPEESAQWSTSPFRNRGVDPTPPPTGSTALPFLRRKSKESTILHFGHMRGTPESPPELKAPRGDDNWQIAYVRSVKALKRGFSQRRMGSRGRIRALETVFYSSRKGGSGDENGDTEAAADQENKAFKVTIIIA